MQILLRPDAQSSRKGFLNFVVTVLLYIDVLNFLAFAVIAIRGIALGVSAPFFSWFKNGTDICFYLGLLLTFVSLPFLASTQQRIRAAISAGLAFGTVMVIAFLTTRG